MKILMYRWKAYNYKDIKKTFQAMGYEVDEMAQQLESYDVDEAFAEKMKEQIKNNTYAFVFTVNYFALIARVCFEKQLLYISWSCDNPLISMYHTSVFYDTNRIFTFDMTNYYEFRSMGVKNIWYLPLAVDTKRMDQVLLVNRDRRKTFAGDISFVGSLYERNSYDKIVPELSEYERGYFDALIETQSDLYGANIVERLLTPEILSRLLEKFSLEKSQESLSNLGLIFATTALGFKIAQVQRKRALLELAKGRSVNVYSNSDLEELLLIKKRGSVDYWTELPQVFHESKINLNLTIPNIKSGIPLRVWDILGAGGFCMTNYQAELGNYFSEEKELVSFGSREEMIEKTDYYLQHETLRRKIAEQGRKTVEEQHTYTKRLEQMLEIIRNNGGFI